MNRKEIIKKLRKQGYTYQWIGDKFSISRQRVHQIITEYVSPFMLRKKRTEEEQKIATKKISEAIKKITRKGIGTIRNITQTTGLNGDSRNRLRELIRIRDNYTCQICGKVWEKGQRRFDIHHLDCDKNKTRKVEKMTQEVVDNMITLCHKCHMNIEEHTEKMSKAQIKVINIDKGFQKEYNKSK